MTLITGLFSGVFYVTSLYIKEKNKLQNCNFFALKQTTFYLFLFKVPYIIAFFPQIKKMLKIVNL